VNIIVAYDKKLEKKVKKILSKPFTFKDLRKIPEHDKCLICYKIIPKYAVVCSEKCKQKLLQIIKKEKKKKKNLKINEV